MSTPDQQDAVVLNDDGAYAHQRVVWKFARHPKRSLPEFRTRGSQIAAGRWLPNRDSFNYSLQ
jgi:hypothetical protein